VVLARKEERSSLLLVLTHQQQLLHACALQPCFRFVVFYVCLICRHY